MSLELTANDVLILENQRLERLQVLLPDPLKRCFLHLSQGNVLTIHCSQPRIVDQLLSDLKRLRWHAWVVTGAHQISICFAEEEIYRTTTRRAVKIQRVHGL